MASADATGFTKLYVNDIPPSVTTEDLRACFSKFGELGEVVVKHGEGERAHFGFVWAGSMETAMAIMATPHQIGDARIPAPVFAKNQRKSSGKSSNGKHSTTAVDPRAVPDKIFVGGLANETTIDTFRAYFEAFGAVKDAIIMQDRMTQRSRGFGFVTFKESSAVSAVLGAQYHEVDGRKVEVKPALPKEAMADEALGVPPKFPDASTGLPFGYDIEPAMGYHLPPAPQFAYGVLAPTLPHGIRVGASVDPPESPSADPLAGAMDGMSLGSAAAPSGAAPSSALLPPPGYPPAAYMPMPPHMMNPAMMNPAMMNPAMMRGVPLGGPVAFAPVGQNGPASPGSPMGSPSYMPMPMGGGGW